MTFLKHFQVEGPMIHVLFTELKNLLKMIMKQFIKSDAIDGISAKTLLGLDIEKQKEIHLLLFCLKTWSLGEKLPDFWQNSLFLINKERKKKC